MVKSTHTHPNPRINRMAQYGAIGLSIVMLISAPLQILLTLLGAPGGLFVITAFVTLVLIPFVIMPTAISPPVTLEQTGLWIEPLIWKRRFVSWEDISAVKVFPLLPDPNAEANRRTFVGRKNYQAADGIMLVIPNLPPQYRIAAFFAGEGGQTIVALTNRTHTDYPKLKKKIVHYAGDIEPHA